MAKKINLVRNPDGTINWEKTKIPPIDFDFRKDEITWVEPKN